MAGNSNSGRHKKEDIPFVEAPKGSGRIPRDTFNVEERKQGRPKKGELVVKPFVVHKRSDMSEKNKEKYAKDAIKRAERLYEKYNREFPNPLNLDIKRIDRAAKEVWEFVFSLRGYTADDAEKMKYRTIENSEEVLFMFEAFCKYIRDNNFMKCFTRPDGSPGMLPIVPNVTNFAQWLGVSGRVVRKAIEDDASAKEEYKTILSDLLSEGAMVGAYTSASAIFTLKNLCDWADNPEDRGMKKQKEFVPVEEAEKALAALGYTRPKLLE
jgi:hypothetical protein